MKIHSFFLNFRLRLISAMGAAILVACGGGGSDNASTTPDAAPPVATPAPVVYEQNNAPSKLSQWNMASSNGTTLTMNESMVPYDLNSALFTDYSLKMRAIYVPPGKKINYTTTGPLDFPIGSAIIKTFYYPKAKGTTPQTHLGVAKETVTPQGMSIDLSKYSLIETRILVRQTDGSWAGLPYVWDADQKDATLTMSGKYVQLELIADTGAPQKFTYVVPNSQTCQKCHATETNGAGSTLPIGPRVRNMNKVYDFGKGMVKNQIVHLDDLKLLSGFNGIANAPRNADWKDPDPAVTLNDRARAYLDVNCAHCHNGTGNASQSGLKLALEDFSASNAALWGVCKTPLAYVGAGKGYKYDIDPGSAATSILLYRMSHVGASQTMPVVGRQTNHAEAIAMVGDWINQLNQSPSNLAACAP